MAVEKSGQAIQTTEQGAHVGVDERDVFSAAAIYAQIVSLRES